MPAWKPAFLIHGDDHGRIAERRANLRALAEAESGANSVEVFENETCTPELVANALSAMTFAMGRRFVIVDGVERWKDSEVEPVIAALAALDADSTTVAFFAREEGRTKVPTGLAKAVKAAGGTTAEETAVKPRDLPRWVVEQAARLQLGVDTNGARALIARVGDRQQRLLRELEKLSLEAGPGARLSAQDIEDASASSSERKAWTLADALVAGDRAAALRALIELRSQGERITGLSFQIVRQLRDANTIASALAAGEAPAQIKNRIPGPPWKVEKMISEIRRLDRDPETYRRALELMADLECETRGGGGGVQSEDTLAVRTITAIAG